METEIGRKIKGTLIQKMTLQFIQSYTSLSSWANGMKMCLLSLLQKAFCIDPINQGHSSLKEYKVKHIPTSFKTMVHSLCGSNLYKAN